MSFDLGNEAWDHTDPENLQGRILPGKYHLLIEGVDDSDEQYVEVSYQILAGDPKGQEGQTGSERLYRSAKAVKRVLMLALATDIVTVDQLTEWKKAGKTNLPLDLHKAEGCQICVEMAKGDKGYVNWTFGGIYALGDPAAKDIPRNDGMLATANRGGSADDLDF